MTDLPHFAPVFLFMCTIGNSHVSQAIALAYKPMITNGFQMVTDEFVPGIGKSPVVIKEVKANGKVVSHDTGLILSTTFVADIYNHTVTFSNLTLKAEFQRLNIFAEVISLCGIYDTDTKALDHDDVLEYVSQIARYTHFQPHLKLQPNIYYKDEYLYEYRYNFWIKLTPNRVDILHKKKVHYYPHVIVLRTLDNEKMYRDVECVIESAVTRNEYVRVLSNGHLGVSPINTTKGSRFVVRQYLGFTSNVKEEYKVFQERSNVHVQILIQEQWPNSSKSSAKFGKAAYVSSGYEDNVFLSTKGPKINNIALNEADPRFFYAKKISGTDFTVFMSTSKFLHYLAVRMSDKKLYLQQIFSMQEFIHGHDNAKFKVLEVGKH